MTHTAIAHESLQRAVSGQSTMNYESILKGFAAMGIPTDAIRPRENVLTYNAWKALGRHVRKGEHGVKAVTFVAVGAKQDPDGEKKAGYRMPRAVTVFHISQTEPDTLQAEKPVALPVIAPVPVAVPEPAKTDKPCQGGCGKVRSVTFQDSPQDWLCYECRMKNQPAPSVDSKPMQHSPVTPQLPPPFSMRAYMPAARVQPAIQGVCVTDEELAEERAALTPDERAIVDALPLE
jgi:N-terminal domain of anti-restriction factor ArdC